MPRVTPLGFNFPKTLRPKALCYNTYITAHSKCDPRTNLGASSKRGSWAPLRPDGFFLPVATSLTGENLLFLLCSSLSTSCPHDPYVYTGLRGSLLHAKAGVDISLQQDFSEPLKS